jgi:hypothetical protein
VRQADPVEVAMKEAGYFPGVSRDALAGAISRYQKLGNWDGGLEITKELYEQALNVFEYSGEVTQRYPWESVCATLPGAPNGSKMVP